MELIIRSLYPGFGKIELDHDTASSSQTRLKVGMLLVTDIPLEV